MRAEQGSDAVEVRHKRARDERDGDAGVCDRIGQYHVLCVNEDERDDGGDEGEVEGKRQS